MPRARWLFKTGRIAAAILEQISLRRPEILTVESSLGLIAAAFAVADVIGAFEL